MWVSTKPGQGHTAGRRTRALEGAVVGFAIGATATYLLTRSSGSTSLCNSSDNQDAMNSRECLGLAVAGGLVGAGVGALVGSRIHVSALQTLPPSPPGQGHRGSRLVIGAVSILALPS
jgi:prolipoprotein diacylglyceryltransferase